MASNLVHDDYFVFKGNYDDNIVLTDIGDDGVFKEPISIGGKYFVPIIDLFGNTLLDNVTIRNKFRDFDSVEKLPFSVRFSVGVYQYIQDAIKSGLKPYSRFRGELYFIAGFLLNAEDRSYGYVFVRAHQVKHEDSTERTYSTNKVRFISYNGEERVLPITTYIYNKDMIPVGTISQEKQFVDFIDMERRFYAKTALFVIDHYRLGGRSLSKIVDFNLDR